MQHVIIVGGGFGGIRTALDLAKKPTIRITLISNNSHFEYYPGLHKMLGISRHVTTSIPLNTVFHDKKNVNLVIDTVISIDPHTKKVITQNNQEIAGDFLVLALGSQTEYFGIEGLSKKSFGFKSVAEAVALRDHIEQLFSKYVSSDKNESLVGLHMMVVGAGPNGVDLAGELASLTKVFSKKYGIIQSLVTIDLIEAGSRILAMMPESVSIRVERRLRALGVNVLCNRDLRKEDSWTVHFADMAIGARTLIWTAGITSNELVKKIPGFILGKKNRIAVDDLLQAKKADGVFKDVFCIGDIADTQYAGLAQTALADGAYVARTISQECTGKKPRNYSPKPVAYNIGVGSRWSVLIIGKFITYGFFPYVMRTLIDIKFFLSILPIREVIKLYFSRK